MPIHFYAESNGVSLNGPGGDDWDLPTQLDQLLAWVIANRNDLRDGPYVADVGFMVRDDAAGGGAVLTPEAMRVFAEMNISIYLSEYVGRDE